MDDYKLIEFFEDGKVELYNLREDIGEEDNLSHEKPKLAENMKMKLENWREKVEAKIPKKNPIYNGE